MKKFMILMTVSIMLLNMCILTSQAQWIAQNSGTSAFLTSVYFPTTDIGYVSLETGQILKTTNGGLDWTLMGAGPMDKLFFLSAQRGFGSGEGCLLETNNGGASWDTAYKNPAIYAITGIHFPDPVNAFATAMDQGMGSYLLRSTDAGINWDTVYHDPMIIPQSLFFIDSLTGFIGGWDGYIYKTTNGGVSWTSNQIDDVNMSMLTSVYFPSADTGYASTDISGVYRTIDGGNNWVQLSYSFPPALYSIFFTDNNHGCVVGGNGISSMSLYQTSDGGNTWTQGASGIQTMNCVHFPDASTAYAVGTNGTILKYTPGSGIGNDLLENGGLRVYPNPACTDVIIEFPMSDNTGMTEISIYSIQGKLLAEFETQASPFVFNVSNLSPGLYFIECKQTGIVRTTKLIIE